MPNYANHTMLELLAARKAVDATTDADQCAAIGKAIETRVTERRRFINPNYGESSFLNDPNSWGSAKGNSNARERSSQSVVVCFFYNMFLSVVGALVFAILR